MKYFRKEIKNGEIYKRDSLDLNEMLAVVWLWF